MEGEDKGRALVEILRNVLGKFPPQEGLEVLGVAWHFMALHARYERLIRPNGFPEEVERQVELLLDMQIYVAGDEPDLEMERLFQEGDVGGMLGRMKTILGGDKGGA